MEAAAAIARTQEIEAVILSDAIEGEAKDIGRMHAAIAREVAEFNRPFPKPVAVLSGGKATVTIGHTKFGKGGRNTEFLLALALDVEVEKIARSMRWQLIRMASTARKTTPALSVTVKPYR